VACHYGRHFFGVVWKWHSSGGVAELWWPCYVSHAERVIAFWLCLIRQVNRYRPEFDITIITPLSNES
jgi:hypothetical protein